MSATKSEKTDSLFDELLDIELEIMTVLGNLMNAEWDSPTLQKDIEKLNKERIRIYDEVELLDGKK